MRIISFLILISVFTSCIQKSEEIGRKSIHKLSKDYECTGFLKGITAYDLKQSIIGNDNLEIQVWEKYTDESRNKVIVFIYDKVGYAIPLLPNIYKKYWNFELDDLEDDKSLINTTFEKEYYKMLETLKIIDSTKIASKSLFKVFNYVIDCRNLYFSDSTEIMDHIDYSDINDIYHVETDSTCYLRKALILKTIYNNNRTLNESNAFWDQLNNRIYQINFDSLSWSKRFNPCLKIYRLDCNVFREMIII